MIEHFHIYYRFIGSSNWWCCCYASARSAQHQCCRREYTHPMDIEPDVAKRHTDRYIAALLPYAAEIRTMRSQELCPHFEQWSSPPAQAELHYKRE